MQTQTASPGRANLVTGLFRDRSSAECAYRAALQGGYQESNINVLMSNETRERFFSAARGSPLQTKAEHAAQVGASKPAEELGGPVGGTAGTLAPVLAAVGTLLLIPGIVIAGPVAIALTAAGAVGVAGGLLGALTNWGIPRDRVEQYEADVRDGGILIGVEAASNADAQQLRTQWQACGGVWVH